MKTITKGKFKFSHYFKAYVAEVPADESHSEKTVTKVEFSKSPMRPDQFTPLFMGVAEAYAEQLLTSNERKDVYEYFNNAFGIFLNKILSEDEIYEVSKPHKEFKERTDKTLGQEEDKEDTENTRMAAYILAKDILTKEAGLTEESADMILNKRLGLLKPIDTSKLTDKGDSNGKSV